MLGAVFPAVPYFRNRQPLAAQSIIILEWNIIPPLPSPFLLWIYYIFIEVCMCYFLIIFILVLSYLESAALAHDAAHKLSEMFQQKQGSYADLSDSNILELMKSNGFDVSSWYIVFVWWSIKKANLKWCCSNSFFSHSFLAECLYSNIVQLSEQNSGRKHWKKEWACPSCMLIRGCIDIIRLMHAWNDIFFNQ